MMVMGEGRVCVVTGARGFAARHIVLMLLQSGSWIVKVSDLHPSIKLDPTEESGALGDALRSGRAVYVSADLRDKAQVINACQGAEVVFHTAAPDSSINNHQLHYSVNVQGTKNVIDACLECKVKKLIYTSSPSVVFDGIHGIFNGDESLPYPKQHNDSYSATKADAEALVLQANGKGGLLTCCIRPSSIFGPGDRLFVPSLVSAARANKSKFIIGDGNNMFDFTYVENVAHAHICAEKALGTEATSEETAAGKAFFVTNMEPIKFWEFTSLILEGLGYPRPGIHIPAPVLMPIAHVVEWTYKLLGPYGMPVPQLTPSRIRLLTIDRTFNCSRAKKLLGYSPIMSLKEGLQKTIESFAHMKAEATSRKGDGSSKAAEYLGGGKVADILLWKDKKQTLGVLLLLFAAYYHFFISGYTVVTAVSKLLLLVMVFLFVNRILPQSVFGYKIEKVPDSCFEISGDMARRATISGMSMWNSGVGVLMSVSRGKDLALFSKVVALLLITSILGAFSTKTFVGIGILFAFTAFYAYDNVKTD
ncbi:unnamed protein product [Victoria cruziana]